MSTHTIPAGHGHAFRAETGQRFRLATPKGQQSADFFAFCADDMSEGLSPHHSWMPTRALHPRPGDTFLSRKRRPMVAFIEDGAEGVHDLLIAPCDPIRYTEFGAPAVDVMGAIKRALDPLDILNPGKAVPRNRD